jgi:hypothetical protein
LHSQHTTHEPEDASGAVVGGEYFKGIRGEEGKKVEVRRLLGMRREPQMAVGGVGEM